MIHNPATTMSHKMISILIALFIIFALLVCRLFYLQIIEQYTFFKQAEKNYQRLENVAPLRGNIVDRHGVLLATNKPTVHVYWKGTGKTQLTTDQMVILKSVATILDQPVIADEDSIESITHAEKYQQELLLARDLSLEQISQIEEQLTYHPNIVLKTSCKRMYPYKNKASHILGYLGALQIPCSGKMGLEKVYDKELHGTDGKRLKTINSIGTSLSHVDLEKALPGQTIQTTLDNNLQEIAEAIFPEANAGVMLIMDPQEGDILALVSRPDFDPNMFLNPITKEEWESLQEEKPFLNRAFGACYPPGSLFKLITASAALEHGVITAESSCFCQGFITFCGRDYHCHCKTGHGLLSSTQAIAKSCDILFYEIAKHLNVDVLADYAARYGLGQTTGSSFAEKKGLVPSSAWKKKTLKERWWTGETLSMAIGQSYLLVSPIQTARLIGSIFTRHLVKPRITFDEIVEKTPLNIKSETLSFLRNSMRFVVTEGTGRAVSRVKDIEIYGKTSTAQVSALEKRELGNKYLEHGWFAAYLRYKTENPLILVILVENSGSSSIATALARDFLIRYKHLVDERHSQSTQDT